MALPADYVERVYAGVLGKIIGVYLGRPFEGWSYERIQRELGEVNYYVHQRFGVPPFCARWQIMNTAATSPQRKLGRHGSTISSKSVRSYGGVG
jgi:hypothetical protein